LRRPSVLTERERNEVVAAVARDLGVAVSPNDPVFVAVAANERVLERAAGAVATRLARDLEDALRAREAQLVTGVSEAVNEEIRRLTQGAARARSSVRRAAKRWLVGLTALGLAEAVAIWFAQRGG
jgi:hypothetical protein